MDDLLMTCNEAAKMLSVRPGTIRAWTAARKIPAVRIGTRAVRYRRSHLERFLRDGERPVLREGGQ